MLFRSSHQRCYVKKGALRNFKASNFIKKETLAQAFSCEFSEISKNTSVRLLLVIILANVFVSRLLPKQSRYLDILFLLALCEQQSNHFFFLVLISMNRDSVLSCNLHSVSKQEEGSSLTCRSISSPLGQGSRL